MTNGMLNKAATAALVAVVPILLISCGDAVPSKSEPAEYTKFLVNEAISRYESEGLEETVAYYNTKESVDGQWYVFIVDQDGFTIAHHNPMLRGRGPQPPCGRHGILLRRRLTGCHRGRSLGRLRTAEP